LIFDIYADVGRVCAVPVSDDRQIAPLHQRASVTEEDHGSC